MSNKLGSQRTHTVNISNYSHCLWQVYWPGRNR